jgi:GNAT superfamily N-acetyltransferase
MSSPLSIRPVAGERERNLFARFPWRIYRDDPLWVPPILKDRIARVDPSRNPFFEHGEAEFLMAWRDGEVVGTIAPAIDHRANELSGGSTAVFGFFECVEDEQVAHALLDRACSWARERGAQRLLGPRSFGSSDEPGLVIEGRATPPGLLMGWSPPYYADCVERYGFQKFDDTLAYRVYRSDFTDEDGVARLPERLVRVAEYAGRRYGYHVRPGNIEEWDDELDVALEIYNRSMSTNPAFVPMGRDDWQRYASGLRPLLQPDLVAFAMAEGKPVGFGLAIPDISCALHRCNGLRRPWDYVKLWWYSRRLPAVSFKILVMLPEYWGRGLDGLIYLHIMRGVLRGGYEWMDMSLTSEKNPMTNKLATRLGAQLDKRYRIYELGLA